MYQLDPTAARKADQTGNRISEIGKYVGTFTQAEDITAGTGTKGVALRFESSGQTANLSLYTTKANGDQIMGYQALMAIMTCMSLRNIAPKPGTVKHWDNDAKVEVSKPGQVFPELCGKPIGLLLETEDYPKNNGGTGTRMVIAGIFQAATELTAGEILDKKTKPEQLAKMVARLRHRPAKAAKAPTGAAAPANGGSGFDDMDDSIPF
jgi:hypothetical protein